MSPADPVLAVGDLTGTHVFLERLRSDHLAEITRAAQGDRSTFGFTQVPADLQEADRYVTALLDDARYGRAAPFAQRRVADGEFVGCTRFMNPSWPLGRSDPDEIEIGGTWLSHGAQRSPINTEAKLLLLTHAFETWAVRRVAICTDARNDRSRRAIERIGASFEGVLRRHRRSTASGETGLLRDTAVYSIIGEEWPAIRQRLSETVTGIPTRDGPRTR